MAAAEARVDVDLEAVHEPVVLDLRRAMSADDRVGALGSTLTSVAATLRSRNALHIIWPKDVDAAVADALLGVSIIRELIKLCGSGQMMIHTKGASVSAFQHCIPSDRISVIVHVTSDERAMVSENGEATPAARLASARRLRDLGWNVVICAGPIATNPAANLSDTFLLRDISAAGFNTRLCRYEGEEFGDFLQRVERQRKLHEKRPRSKEKLSRKSAATFAMA